jgi:hypothetical protein
MVGKTTGVEAQLAYLAGRGIEVVQLQAFDVLARFCAELIRSHFC